MLFGEEIKTPIPFVETERAPTQQELDLWNKAEKVAERVNLLSHLVKLQWKQITQIHQFSQTHKVDLGEPDLPDLAERMFVALRDIEQLKELRSGVNNLILGVRLSSGGNDLDIVEPTEQGFSGWILPAVLGSVVLIGIVARWYQLEFEITEISNKFNGVIKRADKLLCDDPNSDLCQSWEKDKKTGNYYKRTTLIEEVKNAVSTVGQVAKKGGTWGIALAIPLLLWLYLPRGRKE